MDQRQSRTPHRTLAAESTPVEVSTTRTLSCTAGSSLVGPRCRHRAIQERRHEAINSTVEALGGTLRVEVEYGDERLQIA